MHSAVIFGIDAHLIAVEVDVSWGLPSFTIVGLPDTTVRESRDRVRSAIRNCGFEFPQHRVTVNLAPAGLPKAGTSFDLPIAIGILVAGGQLGELMPAELVVIGELSLAGQVHPSRGVLPIAVQARRAGSRGLLLPTTNAPEAALVGGLSLCPVDTLPEAAAAIANPDQWERPFVRSDPPSSEPGPDLADVKGQLLARRALEITAAGGHHLLMVGPPGTGKTMLARRLPGILPPMTFEEALEVTVVQSVAGLLGGGGGLARTRPFRAPHHTISDAALIGGGTSPRPGEISLAHHGVLFLDEAPEFTRRVLETLRQPLESGEITVARSARTARFPALFQLVAAMNPCPCGQSQTQGRECRCTPTQVALYESRLSAPLRDRIDLVVQVGPVDAEALTSRKPGEPTAAVRERVAEARRRQHERTPGTVNARLDGRALDEACALDRAAAQLLRDAFARLGLSARARSRALRVSRTIADLEAAPTVGAAHIAEALQFRTR